MKLMFGLLFVASGLLVACTSSTGDPTAEPTAVGTQTATGSIALTNDAAASCVETYSLTTLANRAFAFDGTVTDIEPPADTTPGSLSYAIVTFEVHEWFRAAGPDRISVEMNPPGSHSTLNETGYAIGSRLLISGEPRWGGEPLDDPIVWSCGFSRTHDPEVAADWRDAVS